MVEHTFVCKVVRERTLMHIRKNKVWMKNKYLSSDLTDYQVHKLRFQISRNQIATKRLVDNLGSKVQQCLAKAMGVQLTHMDTDHNSKKAEDNDRIQDEKFRCLTLEGHKINQSKDPTSLQILRVGLLCTTSHTRVFGGKYRYVLITHLKHPIGEILRGDRMVNTPYEINMAKDVSCAILCKKQSLTKQSASVFKSFIEDDYSIQLSIDGLIGATKFESSETGKQYVLGTKLGIHLAGVTYIYNHLRFRLQYNTVDNISESHLPSSNGACKKPSTPLPSSQWQAITENTKSLQFSYEVMWEPSDIRWASRWDVFLRSDGGQVHWFSIVNSLVIVVFLTTVIAMILVRTLRKDIAKYNRDDDAEDILEESGWKLVHGDVFRPPRHIRLLTALFGSGVQVFCMVFVTICEFLSSRTPTSNRLYTTIDGSSHVRNFVIFLLLLFVYFRSPLVFAMLGMLSPASRGAVMTAAIFTYVFMGVFAGYYAGRLYKTMRGMLWKSTAVMTGMFFPTLLLIIGLVLNTFVWYKRSSAAVPFTTMLAILALWLGISLPLVYTGFFFGYRKRPFELPVRTNQIPRAVPPAKFHQNLLVSTLLAGALPFGAVFIEVFFIYMALWESRFYYLFGFLFVVFVILIICCAQVAIVLTYFQLCNEDYRWWWRTFVASGGPALYLFVYSIFYYWTKLDITQFVPTVVYFGYTVLMVLVFWVLTGAIGFTATFVFLRHIYSAIKID
ncbi:endomembrane protein 70 [Opisthorchis viverrini]|uniref:Transmembrane 9 superfamily member n=1 Tax=Opisthorchis viverrini TaxID=6198 RepID=A0A1S8WL50_OPIVI|nr:endomembrane protein 70 [Opisthorchis viverrini]